MIALTRVDDRLIHGLVAVAWTSHIAPETILVANDSAASDPIKKSAMKLAKPAGVKLVVKSIDAAISALNNPINNSKRIFLVTETVEDAARIHAGLTVKFDQLNIGTCGLNKKPGVEYRATIPQVYMTDDDYAWAAKLDAAGVTVFCQANPTLERMDFAGISKVFA